MARGGEVEARRTPPRYAALSPSCRHQLPRIVLATATTVEWVSVKLIVRIPTKPPGIPEWCRPGFRHDVARGLAPSLANNFWHSVVGRSILGCFVGTRASQAMAGEIDPVRVVDDAIGVARSLDSPLRHHWDRQWQLALQEPRRRSSPRPRSRRLRNPGQLRRRAQLASGNLSLAPSFSDSRACLLGSHP